MTDVTSQPLLHQLPTVIDKPGIYVLRDGRKAVIHHIDGPASFCAKGAVYRAFRGKMRPRGYRGWHPSGRANAVAPHHSDIVAWDDQQSVPEMPE